MFAFVCVRARERECVRVPLLCGGVPLWVLRRRHVAVLGFRALVFWMRYRVGVEEEPYTNCFNKERSNSRGATAMEMNNSDDDRDIDIESDVSIVCIVCVCRVA